MLDILWEKSKKVYIVGAQSRAKTLKGYLNYLYPSMSIDAFLVDDLSCNDSEIQEIPVLEIQGIQIENTEIPVLIATKGIYHEEITGQLQQQGFRNIIPITIEIDNILRNAYVKKYYEGLNQAFIKIEDLIASIETDIKTMEECGKIKASVYVAKSVYDKPLQSSYQMASYEKAIQVGAALVEERLEDVEYLDCQGDNISIKNRQYCELTALYWLWKNCQEDIIGLAHYRRHFILPDHWQELMLSENIDVILPVPTYVYPNIEENYKERHDPLDWDYMLEYLSINHREYFQVAEKIYKENLYFPCNMLIARREVLVELCEFIFPVLDAVVKNGGTKEDTYFNRYPGFLSERLITLFFMKNKNRFKIIYADKSFIP